MKECAVTPQEAELLLQTFSSTFAGFREKGYEEQGADWATPDLGDRYLGKMDYMPDQTRTYTKDDPELGMPRGIGEKYVSDGVAEYFLITPYTDTFGVRNTIFRYGGSNHSELVVLGIDDEGFGGPIAKGSDAVPLAMEHILYEANK